MDELVRDRFSGPFLSSLISKKENSQDVTFYLYYTDWSIYLSRKERAFYAKKSPGIVTWLLTRRCTRSHTTAEQQQIMAQPQMRRPSLPGRDGLLEIPFPLPVISVKPGEAPYQGGLWLSRAPPLWYTAPDDKQTEIPLLVIRYLMWYFISTISSLAGKRRSEPYEQFQ